jgi:hypothetical protein
MESITFNKKKFFSDCGSSKNHKKCHKKCHKQKDHCKEVEVKSDKKCCATEITQCDINTHNGYIIRKSGLYKLCEDIVFNNPLHPAITISASSVILDLNGHTIDLLGQGLIAIGVNNVVDTQIINGTLKNGNLSATINDDIVFYPVSDTNPFLSPNPTSLDSATPNGVIVKSAGIRLSGVDVVKLEDLVIDKFLYGIASTATIGHIYINECNIVNCGNSSGTSSTLIQPVGAGIVLAGSSVSPILTNPANLSGIMNDVRITNSNINSANTRYGVLIISGRGILIENTYGTSGRPDINSPVNYLLVMAVFNFINCQFGHVYDSYARVGNDGFQMVYSNKFDFWDCQSSDMAHNGFELGFSNNSVLKNCITYRNADSEPRAYGGRGFTLLGSTNCIVDTCIASDYTVGATNPPIGLPRSTIVGTNGYGVALVGCKACIVKDSTALNNLGGFLEFTNNPPVATIAYPGGTAPISTGSNGNPLIADWNSFLRNIAQDNTNSVTPFSTPANNYNLPLYQASITGIVTPYTAIGTASAWTNIAVPNNLGGNPAV